MAATFLSLPSDQDLISFIGSVEALTAIEQGAREGRIEGSLIRLECVVKCVQRLQHLLSISGLLSAVYEMLYSLRSIVTDEAAVYRSPGRPRFILTRDQLQYLLDQEFTQVEIAKMLGCSAKTIHRRIVPFGLSHVCEYSIRSSY